MNVRSLYDGIKGGDYKTENNVKIYHNNDYYIIETGNDNTHDNILIMCKNEKLLHEIYNSLTYNQNNSTMNQTTSSSNNSSEKNINSSSSSNELDEYDERFKNENPDVQAQAQYYKQTHKNYKDSGSVVAREYSSDGKSVKLWYADGRTSISSTE